MIHKRLEHCTAYPLKCVRRKHCALLRSHTKRSKILVILGADKILLVHERTGTKLQDNNTYITYFYNMSDFRSEVFNN